MWDGAVVRVPGAGAGDGGKERLYNILRAADKRVASINKGGERNAGRKGGLGELLAVEEDRINGYFPRDWVDIRRRVNAALLGRVPTDRNPRKRVIGNTLGKPADGEYAGIAADLDGVPLEGDSELRRGERALRDEA